MRTEMDTLDEGVPVLNMTGRDATMQEIAEGVIEPSPAVKAEILKELSLNMRGVYRAGACGDALGLIAKR